ncbi:MAG: YbaB/EbfC family nucleoid-associated protein [Nocardiaceae bacterium]|nr:YbaB/EbfC family nucleoid-associated protein [Nocardiaceae bacterium]
MALEFAGEAQAKIDAMMADFNTRLAKIGELQRKSSQLTARATSDDSMVTIWVNAAGTIIKTEIDPAAPRELGIDGLAAAITHTAQQASTDVRRQVSATMSEIMAAGDMAAMRQKLLGDVPAPPNVVELLRSTRVEPSLAPPEAEERWRTDSSDDDPRGSAW